MSRKGQKIIAQESVGLCREEVMILSRFVASPTHPGFELFRRQPTPGNPSIEQLFFAWR
jgi:hypothetical protein